MDHKQILSAGSFAVDFLSKSDPFHLLIATDDPNPRTFLNIYVPDKMGLLDIHMTVFFLVFGPTLLFFFPKIKFIR